MEFNIVDRMLIHIFKNHTYKVYKMGLQDGFNWGNGFPTFFPLWFEIKQNK